MTAFVAQIDSGWADEPLTLVLSVSGVLYDTAAMTVSEVGGVSRATATIDTSEYGAVLVDAVVVTSVGTIVWVGQFSLDANNQIDSALSLLEGIDAKTQLIGTGSSFIPGPMTLDGELPFLIIGDDYLAANNRDLKWIVPKVTGFVTATCTCRFGLRSINGHDRFVVTGTVTDHDDTNWQISFDLPKVETLGFKPGPYNYTASVLHAGVEITSVVPRDTVVTLLRKYS
jgi:hypothetical protein